MLAKEGIRCFWVAMPVYFDGKDGWISLCLNRSLYPAVVTYLGNLPKDVVIYNHFGHYASQRSRSKLFGKSTLVLCSAASTPAACIELFPWGTRKHFHERLYVHVSNILTHLAHLPWNNEGTRNWQNLFAITSFRYIEVLFHIFYYYWGEENRSLYRGLRYIVVRYIEVPLPQ